MKTLIAITLLASALLVVGCETEGQKMEDLKAEEAKRDAQQQLSLGAMAYNLDKCFAHLNITMENAYRSKKWARIQEGPPHHLRTHRNVRRRPQRLLGASRPHFAESR